MSGKVVGRSGGFALYLQTLWLLGAPQASMYSETASGLSRPVRFGSRCWKNSFIRAVKQGVGVISGLKKEVHPLR